MSYTRDDLEDKLKYTIKEQKKILNNVSLVLIVWVMLISLGLFLSRRIPEINDTITFFGFLSIVPVILLEIKIIMKLSRVKKEKTVLEQSRTKFEPSDEYEEYVK